MVSNKSFMNVKLPVYERLVAAAWLGEDRVPETTPRTTWRGGGKTEGTGVTELVTCSDGQNLVDGRALDPILEEARKQQHQRNQATVSASKEETHFRWALPLLPPRV